MISPLEKKIGYNFNDKFLLQQALTHASKSPQHLERQEFLGDAVLGLTISEYLFQHYPDSAEGDLSKMRANLVCKRALLAVAKDWQLALHLNVGDGERTKQGKLKSESIAANAVESVIGAVFQDGGWDEARKVIIKAWKATLKDVKPVNLRDAKSQLQEITQAHGLGLPLYEVKDLGLNAKPRFQATCILQSKCLGIGLGDRKKSAEIHAASLALKNNALESFIIDI